MARTHTFQTPEKPLDRCVRYALIFWLLIGSGIGASFRPPSSSGSVNYLEYFYPGTVLLVVLFTAIFSTFSVIEDRREGFLLSVLVAPVSRLAIVLGKVLGGTTIALLQGLLLLLLAPLLGFRLQLVSVLILVAAMFGVSFWLTGLGFSLAWRINSSAGFHSLMNLVLLPMWLLSGALFPPAGASGWVQWIMAINPLTYGLALLRGGLYWSQSDPAGYFPNMTFSALVTLLCAISSMFFSTRFQGQGWIRGIYFVILISHSILAAVVVPLVLLTLSRGLRERYPSHRRVARWTLPIWLYVSVTGVLVYLMLYHLS